MRGMWGTTALAAVLGAGAILGTAEAQESGERQYAEADTLTVTATRTEQDTYAVPSVVTVITEEQIEDNLATDIKDLIRFEPGVSVRNAPARYSAQSGTGRDGNAGFNIRGLEDNRVLIVVDGVRVPDGFSFGPGVFGRGDYVDLDLLSRVEIVRGPASALYGSDGLAGVVSFTTRDPSDFLRPDETFAARVRASYASADDSWAEGLAAGGRWGNWSGLFSYTRRDGHEQENRGENDALNSTRTAPNPQDIESNAAMARLVFEPSDANRFRVTLDYSDREAITEVYSARSAAPPPPPFQTVLDFDALDTSERQRIAFDHTYEGEGFLDRAFWSVYYQTAEIVEFHAEDRNLSDRTRITTFENDVWGVSGQLESEFTIGASEHHVTYGGDYSVTTQEGVRDGILPAGEVFPTRPFPNTDYTLAGLFVQDEISFMDGRVVLFPAVRFDAYELEPEDDALYPLAVVSQSDERVSPRFGVVVWPGEHVGVFFNYAQGFKAPSPNQVNQSFTNATQFYTSIPNPDLAPETSETVEIGLRLRDVQASGATWRASATAFAGWYDDFIEQVQVSGPPFGTGSPGNLSVFQVINLGEVEIDGFEARVDGAWESGFGLTIAYSFAEGDQIENGVRAPLDSIDPWKLVTGLSYNDPNGAWGGQLIATHVTRKSEDRAAAGAFRPDAFSILDATAYWNVTDRATLRVGVFNITDETYWWWSDVRNTLASSTTLGAFTQPGVNYSASISYRF